MNLATTITKSPLCRHHDHRPRNNKQREKKIVYD